MLTYDRMASTKVQMLQSQVAMLTALVSALQNQVKSLESRMESFVPDVAPSNNQTEKPWCKAEEEDYETDEEPIYTDRSKVKEVLPRYEFVLVDEPTDEYGYDTDD